MRTYPSALNPDISVLLPEGRLDAMGSPALESELASLHAHERKQIVLNLRQTTYISSSGLRVILIHARRLRRAGGDLKLCCVTGKVERVMYIAGFDTVLDIFADEDLAVKAFQASDEAATASCHPVGDATLHPNPQPSGEAGVQDGAGQ